MKLAYFFSLMSIFCLSRLSRYMIAFFLEIFSVFTLLQAVRSPSYDLRYSSTSNEFASVFPIMQATKVSSTRTGHSSLLDLKNLYTYLILFFVNSFWVLTLSISLSLTIFSLAATSFLSSLIFVSFSLISFSLFWISSTNHFSQSE